MQACLDQMTELGIPGIHLKTTSMNTAAIKLYEKMGFDSWLASARISGTSGCPGRRSRIWCSANGWVREAWKAVA